MDSVWSESVKLPSFKTLSEDIKTDILIIGGGLAGLLCAHMLDKSGADYELVEAERICGKITKNTTAKITSQHGLIYAKLISRFGIEKAQLYLKANEAALGEYRKLCQSVDCDFETTNAYVYSLEDRKKIYDEILALNRLGYFSGFIKETTLPFHIAGAAEFKNQAQFNPLKFASEVARGLNIYEKTRVLELVQNTAITSGGKIKANKIIVATHFPFINKHGSYFLKMYQSRSYVIALENAQNVNGVYLDEAENGMSFRNYKNLLLIGGGGHRTGKRGGNWNELQDFAKRHYPKSKEKYRFATQDCMTLDGVPYIGNYSKNTPDLFVATGFNKWGMTSSMAAAMILTDLVQGKKNQYAKVFSPSRTILRPQLAINAAEAMISILKPTIKRCPHMGCALKWNKNEHTWDCPCHGSRFSENGKLIDNPATGGLNE